MSIEFTKTETKEEVDLDESVQIVPKSPHFFIEKIISSQLKGPFRESIEFRTLKHQNINMTYPFIPIGLIAVFAVVILYLLIIKKDMKKVKAILYPGLFFIAIWVVIYYFLLR